MMRGVRLVSGCVCYFKLLAATLSLPQSVPLACVLTAVAFIRGSTPLKHAPHDVLPHLILTPSYDLWMTYSLAVQLKTLRASTETRGTCLSTWPSPKTCELIGRKNRSVRWHQINHLFEHVAITKGLSVDRRLDTVC